MTGQSRPDVLPGWRKNVSEALTPYRPQYIVAPVSGDTIFAAACIPWSTARGKEVIRVVKRKAKKRKTTKRKATKRKATKKKATKRKAKKKKATKKK
jgi:hypothetical protein